MAARVKTPAETRAPPPAARAAEGGAGGWLYRVFGRSPALGDLKVCLLLPQLLPPSALGRMAGLLSGDARFEMIEMQGVPLPFPARGHVVVDWGKERVLAAAVPEEVRRRLEEHWARRPVVPLRGPLVLGKDTSQLRRLAERYGGVEVYGVGYRDSSGRLSALSAVLELRPSRPLAREELRALLEEVLLSHESPRFADILALADLWALAMGAPSVYWGAWESLWESFSVPSASGRAREVETIPLPLTGWLGHPLPPCFSFEAGGSRGRAALSFDSLDIVVLKLDAELLARLEEVEEALETFKGAFDRWDVLLGSLAEACGAALSELGADAPSIVREALA